MGEFEMVMQEMNDLLNKNQPETIEPKDVIFHNRIFMLDVSSSMAGDKLDNAKITLNRFKKIDDGLVVFGEEAYYVFGGNLNTVLPFGLTAMLPAFEISMKHRPTEIIMITDGQPNIGGGTFEVLEYVRDKVTGVQINTIGIGYDCDDEFLQTISEETNGTYQHIDNPGKLSNAVALLCAPVNQIEL
jgi:Mg-chelatase subunit ChlD